MAREDWKIIRALSEVCILVCIWATSQQMTLMCIVYAAPNIVYKYLNTLGNTCNFNFNNFYFSLPILAGYLSILFQLRLLATLCLTMSCLKSGKGCLRWPLIWCDTMTSNLPTSLHWLRNSQRLVQSPEQSFIRLHFSLNRMWSSYCELTRRAYAHEWIQCCSSGYGITHQSSHQPSL